MLEPGSPTEVSPITPPPPNGPRSRVWVYLKKHWELLTGFVFATTLGLSHVYSTWTWPLPRLVFREGNLTYFDRGGAEAFTHLDRLAAYGAMKACKAGPIDCLPQVLEVADRHHPPVTAMSAALWNQFAGLGIPETLLINLLWLALLLASVHSMARRMSGPLGAWMATFLVASAPVIIGPSRLLHQDLPMTALLAAFGALLLALGQSAKLRLVPIIALVGTLAVLTKWEMVFGIGSAGLAGGIYALTQGRRYKTLPALIAAAGLLLVGLHTYVEHIPSHSFKERPQLKAIAMPQYTWYFIKMALSAPEDGPPPPSTHVSGTIPERILFYLEAAPVSAVGALPTLFMLLGIGVMVWRRQWASLSFGGSWILLSLGLLGALVTSFGDDRFVHFFVLPMAALGGAGLSRTRAAPLFAALTLGTFLLHLADMTLPNSPLPLAPSISLPLPGEYLQTPRALNLRPDIPYGHGTWIRPESRTYIDRDAVERALSMAAKGGAKRVLLAPTATGTAEASYIWVVESLLMIGAPPIGLKAESIARGVGLESQCSMLSEELLSREIKAGAWLVIDRPASTKALDLEALPWEKLTCGYLDDPALMGLKPRLAGQIPTNRDTLFLVELQEVAQAPR